jgi:phosphatidylserine/phosphatidylglycerophosphate/cardiolipin synthase-like enzyme
MGNLQHNKMIVVDGAKARAAVVGSTNHSWRGFYVQNNNAIILKGKNAVKLCMKAFDDYWANDNVKGFSGSASAVWNDLKLGIDAAD